MLTYAHSSSRQSRFLNPWHPHFSIICLSITLSYILPSSKVSSSISSISRATSSQSLQCWCMDCKRRLRQISCNMACVKNTCCVIHISQCYNYCLVLYTLKVTHSTQAWWTLVSLSNNRNGNAIPGLIADLNDIGRLINGLLLSTKWHAKRAWPGCLAPASPVYTHGKSPVNKMLSTLILSLV